MNTHKCGRCYRHFQTNSRTDYYCKSCRSIYNKIYYKERKKSAVV